MESELAKNGGLNKGLLTDQFPTLFDRNRPVLEGKRPERDGFGGS